MVITIITIITRAVINEAVPNEMGGSNKYEPDIQIPADTRPNSVIVAAPLPNLANINKSPTINPAPVSKILVIRISVKEIRINLLML